MLDKTKYIVNICKYKKYIVNICKYRKTIKNNSFINLSDKSRYINIIIHVLTREHIQPVICGKMEIIDN